MTKLRVSPISVIPVARLAHEVPSIDSMLENPGDVYLVTRPAELKTYAPPAFTNDPTQSKLILEQGTSGVSGLGQKSYNMVSGKIECGKEFLALLSDVEIEPTTGFSYLERDILLADSYHGPFVIMNALSGIGRLLPVNSDKMENFSVVWRPLPERQRIIEEPVYSIFSLFSGAHYHFLMDLLPKLRYLTSVSCLADVKLVGPPIPPGSFAEASLAALGLRERLIEVNEPVRCSRMWFPSMMNPGGLSREQGDFVRTLLRTAFKIGVSQNDLMVYVSRRGAAERFVLNEDEVVAALEKIGFIIVAPGEMTPAQQIEVFSRANFIVGPIGSNNTNIVFAEDGVSVLELMPRTYCHPSIWMMAVQKGMKYGMHVCDDFDARFNMRIDVGDLLSMVNEMLRERGG